ncbi:hypothetical protein [Clostridium beijerinckii]|uniref:hypothetical protein n=1 Tax=Clostridium beijerinckii TaxID=1520 RepID=UPI00098C6D4C|nr:hypothetical protein [Clostridium beijerinckii]MBA8935541.1 hypothetical protein [Clostridium beijerinckii]NRU39936.1 hypothetical protein [Clostridium beijerinckii]NSA96785.1 hypothetical protein [Clostridium beijerinckii]OOM65515.1 hypothetical protein CLBEIC_51530 [Clostridium beijerinckii]CUU47326.1 protein of unknown function [Clostridium beijerinckii]
MQWEIEFALRQRELSFDIPFIRKVMKNTANNLEESFKKYEVNLSASFDDAFTIFIDDYKDVTVKLSDERLVFSTNLDEDHIFAEVTIENGMYVIEYCNSQKPIEKVFFLDEREISNIIGNVIFFNMNE